mmetsp:Transcript_21649/g.43580  ORF Transcript_21649/g.43580 Transcript_21649/m.43580 type:complete len:98 (+) Transcript_21649:574-867(+)
MAEGGEGMAGARVFITEEAAAEQAAKALASPRTSCSKQRTLWQGTRGLCNVSLPSLSLTGACTEMQPDDTFELDTEGEGEDAKGDFVVAAVTTAETM